MLSGPPVHQDLQTSHPRPPSPPGSAPASRAVRRLPRACRVCVLPLGGTRTPCAGGQPTPVCSPPPHAYRPGPLWSLHCLHSVSESSRNVHGKKTRGKPAARSAREQGEAGRPRAHLRSSERPDPTAQSTSRAQSTAGPPPSSAGTSELQTSGAEGRPGTGHQGTNEARSPASPGAAWPERGLSPKPAGTQRVCPAAPCLATLVTTGASALSSRDPGKRTHNCCKLDSPRAPCTPHLQHSG